MADVFWDICAAKYETGNEIKHERTEMQCCLNPSFFLDVAFPLANQTRAGLKIPNSTEGIPDNSVFRSWLWWGVLCMPLNHQIERAMFGMEFGEGDATK